MSWTTPPTWSADTIVASSDLQLVSDDLTYLKAQTDALGASAVKLNRTSAQSIPDNTWTAVTWNNQIGDLGGYWSSGTDIVVPSDFPAGVSTYFYDVPVVAVFATNATGSRGVRTLLNGTVVEQYSIGAPSADPAVLSFPTSIFEVAEADVITVEVLQNSGGALNLNGVVVTAERRFPSS